MLEKRGLSCSPPPKEDSGAELGDFLGKRAKEFERISHLGDPAFDCRCFRLQSYSPAGYGIGVIIGGSLTANSRVYPF
jgi:hypothetical protein